MGDYHVRFCERLGVRFPLSTRPRWNCKYHIAFTPKYRRKVIYGELRKDIGRILRKFCEMKEVEIIEAHALPDHIYMLVRVPPKVSVSQFMGKGRSTTLIHEQHGSESINMGIKVSAPKDIT